MGAEGRDGERKSSKSSFQRELGIGKALPSKQGGALRIPFSCLPALPQPAVALLSPAPLGSSSPSKEFPTHLAGGPLCIILALLHGCGQFVHGTDENVA